MKVVEAKIFYGVMNGSGDKRELSCNCLILQVRELMLFDLLDTLKQTQSTESQLERTEEDLHVL